MTHCSAGYEIPIHFDSLTLQEFGPDTPDEKSFLRSGFHGKERTVKLNGPEDLRPWRELAPDLPQFAGKGVYRGGFTLDGKDEERRYFLILGEVCDTFRVWVNGAEADFPDQVLKRVDITQLVREGENTLEVRVVSNLYNRLPPTGGSMQFPFPVHFIPKDYGIFETDGKRCVLRVL